MKLKIKSSKFILFLILLLFVFCTNVSTPNTKIIPPQLPSNLSFAGERVPLEDPDVKERLDRELIINQNYHSSTILIYKTLGRYKTYIQDILKENEVPEDFFYLAVAESALNPNANSPAGANGLWQFLQQTGEMYGLEVSNYVDERRNLTKSTKAACKYLKDSYKDFGSWTLAAAAYNRGNKGMRDAIIAQKENDYYKLYLNSETYRYIFRIIALKLILSNPEEYNFKLSENDFYPQYKFKSVAVSQTIESIPDFAKSNGITYKELILHNPWIRTIKYNFEVQPGKNYEFLIPIK
jgi:membrane-bound lytic murein transglycosylase D